MKGADTVFFILASIMIVFLMILVIVRLVTKKDDDSSAYSSSSEPTIIEQVIEVPRTIYRTGYNTADRAYRRSYDYVNRRVVRPIRRYVDPYI